MKAIVRISVYTCLILLLASCGSSDKKAELEKLKKERSELDARIKLLESEISDSGDSATKTVTVQTTEIKVTGFNHYLEVQGVVDGEDNIGISAQMPGVITSIYVKEGDRVKKGQVLAQIESNALQQQYESARTQLDFATSVYNKQKALWDQQIGSEIQYLTARNNKETAEKGVAALGEQLEMTRIKSPINGTVEELNLRIGQMVSPGMPAIRVVNFSNVKVVADIAEAYAQNVKPGAEAIVEIPDLNKEIKAKIDFTSKYIDPVNRTFSTEIRLKPGEVEFRANMMARISILNYSNPEALTVPVSLVRETVEGQFIYVARKNENQWIAKRQAIKIGKTYNGVAEVIEGLNPGDQIITSGNHNLQDGQILKVI